MKFKNRIRILAVALVALLVLFTCTLVGGCEVLKSKKTTSIDSTSVKKETLAQTMTSSGGSISTTQSTDKSQYDRTTFLFPTFDTSRFDKYLDQHMESHPYQPGQPPIIQSQPYSPVQPYAIIHETGTNEQNTKTVDSTWQSRMESLLMAFMDSTNRKVAESTKTKETKEPWITSLGLIVLMIGILILFEVLKKAVNKYRIVKK
jgi:hypothetical protein